MVGLTPGGPPPHSPIIGALGRAGAVGYAYMAPPGHRGAAMFAVVLTCVSFAPADDLPAKVDPAELKRFEGAWRLTTQEHGGKKSDKKEIAGITLDVKGTKWVTRDGVEVKEEA